MGRQAHRGTQDRPDDCTCLCDQGDLPCFACYNAGFDSPNPEAQSVAEYLDEEGTE